MRVHMHVQSEAERRATSGPFPNLRNKDPSGEKANPLPGRMWGAEKADAQAPCAMESDSKGEGDVNVLARLETARPDAKPSPFVVSAAWGPRLENDFVKDFNKSIISDRTWLI